MIDYLGYQLLLGSFTVQSKFIVMQTDKTSLTAYHICLCQIFFVCKILSAYSQPAFCHQHPGLNSWNTIPTYRTGLRIREQLISHSDSEEDKMERVIIQIAFYHSWIHPNCLTAFGSFNFKKHEKIAKDLLLIKVSRIQDPEGFSPISTMHINKNQDISNKTTGHRVQSSPM